MDIMKLILDKLDDNDIINNLSGQMDADNEKVKQAAKLSIPAMLKGLEENSETDHGAKSLDDALDTHKDDDISDISGFLKRADRSEGDKALSHMFGDRRGNVENNIAKESGLDVNQVAQIMQQLAPLLLGFLGNKRGSHSGGVGSLLGSLLGGSGGIMGMASELLRNNNASNKNSPTEIGDILGGLFKNK